jgi:hypothetical protein
MQNSVASGNTEKFDASITRKSNDTEADCRDARRQRREFPALFLLLSAFETLKTV